MHGPKTLLLALSLVGAAAGASAQVSSNGSAHSVTREPYPGLSFVTPPPQVATARDRDLERKLDQTGTVIRAPVRQQRP